MVQLSALCAASSLQAQVVRPATGKAQQRRDMLPQTTLPLTHVIPHHEVVASKPPASRCVRNTPPLAPVQVAP